MSNGSNRGHAAYANFVMSMSGFFGATSGSIGAMTGQLNEMYNAGQSLNGQLDAVTKQAAQAGENTSNPEAANAEIAIAQVNLQQVNQEHSVLSNNEQQKMSLIKGLVETEESGSKLGQSLINVLGSKALVRKPN
ncbi:MAG: hypothetical protein P0S94_04750 [Simkaniaceae bacterium]|nr:hypothetical protein [Simkaniaceae bacterium]